MLPFLHGIHSTMSGLLAGPVNIIYIVGNGESPTLSQDLYERRPRSSVLRSPGKYYISSIDSIRSLSSY